LRAPLAAIIVTAVALVVGACGSSSSSSSSSTKPSARKSPGSQTTGEVRVLWTRPQTKANALGAFLLKKGEIPGITHQLATTFELPNPLTIRLVNGFGQGPFFNPDNNSITDPYLFATVVFKVLKDDNPNWSPHQLGYATGAVDAFVLVHEFGHALIANYDLPVLGKEEDAADTISTIILLQGSQGYKLDTSAATFWADFSGRQDPPSLAAYADSHSLDLQRADNIICDVAGSSRRNFRRVASLRVLPQSRLAACRSEFLQAAQSIEQELQPHLKKKLTLSG
jgi:hypothetical protein